MDLKSAPRFAYYMADGTTQEPSEERAPLGSWPRVYVLCCVVAVVVMVLLYWFASHYNVRPTAN